MEGSREGGRRAVEDVRSVEEDFVRVCPGIRDAEGRELVELVDVFRIWRDCVSGGLERSFLTGSVVVVGGVAC